MGDLISLPGSRRPYRIPAPKENKHHVKACNDCPCYQYVQDRLQRLIDR